MRKSESIITNLLIEFKKLDIILGVKANIKQIASLKRNSLKVGKKLNLIKNMPQKISTFYFRKNY